MDLPEMLDALVAVFPDGPSWPFRTKSARTLWKSAEQTLSKHPSWEMGMILQQAAADTGVSGYELTPEDYSILDMAFRWKRRELQLAGVQDEKEPEPAPAASAAPKPSLKSLTKSLKGKWRKN